MPWKYNGSVVATNKGFKTTDGYTTPRNWVTVCDDTEKKNQGLTWEEPDTTLTDAEKLQQLRDLRNAKLQETDWRANSDLTMSDEWKTYRQSLRDISTHSNWPFLEDSDWPTKPS